MLKPGREELLEAAHVLELQEEAGHILENPELLCSTPDRVLRLILDLKAFVEAGDVCNRLDPDVKRWLREHRFDEDGED
jgi:hypothetical protein